MYPGEGTPGRQGAMIREGESSRVSHHVEETRRPHLLKVDDLPMELLRCYPTSDQGRDMTGLWGASPASKRREEPWSAGRPYPGWGESNVEETWTLRGHGSGAFMPGSQVNTSTSTGCVTTLEAGLLQDLPAPRRRTDGQENTGAVTNFNLIGHGQEHGILS